MGFFWLFFFLGEGVPVGSFFDSFWLCRFFMGFFLSLPLFWLFWFLLALWVFFGFFGRGVPIVFLLAFFGSVPFGSPPVLLAPPSRSLPGCCEGMTKKYLLHPALLRSLLAFGSLALWLSSALVGSQRLNSRIFLCLSHPLFVSM